MTLVPFPTRARGPASTVADWRTRPRATPEGRIALRKADRERRYCLQLERPSRWVGEVWFDRALHRRRRVSGVFDANALKDQFLREIGDLLADGWTPDGPPDSGT